MKVRTLLSPMLRVGVPLVLMGLSAAGCSARTAVYKPDPMTPPSVTVVQAKRMMLTTAKRIRWKGMAINISSQRFKITDERFSCSVEFNSIHEIIVYKVSPLDNPTHYRVEIRGDEGKGWCVLAERGLRYEMVLAWSTEEDARLFANALYILKRRAAGETNPADVEEQAAFKEVVRRYRSLPVKPALPEEARRFKVQAEVAIEEKRYDDAIDLYESALKVAPWWPEGRFNRALLLGQESIYDEAVLEMKRYLELVPDAVNARAAQDKIYEWEGAMQRSRRPSAPAPGPAFR